MTARKPCYGTMFPDVVAPFDTGIRRGKALSFEIKNIGLARGERRVEVSEKEWDDCLGCPDFETCYKLSTAKLMLQNAIRDA